MKLAYITTQDQFGTQRTGGTHGNNRNLNLLKQSLGSENVYICAISNDKELSVQSERNFATFHNDLSRRINHIKFALSGRRLIGKKTESAVIAHICKLDCDAVFIESSNLGFLQERLPKKMKQVLYTHNIEREYVINRLLKQPSWLTILLPTVLNESKAVRNADIIISINNRDALLLQKYYGRSPDLILPVTFDDSYTAPKNDKQNRKNSSLQLLFVGSLFLPNKHGVTWFVNEVMPYVNAEFTIVGTDFEKLSDNLHRKNVKVVGTVADLSEYYHNTDAIVSPILFGAGMKVKTAEALMYGKPMFATDEALEGYEVDGLKNVYRCNTASEFIEAINSYAENPPYLSFDSDNRKLFLEKHHTPKYVPEIENLLGAKG